MGRRGPEQEELTVGLFTGVRMRWWHGAGSAHQRAHTATKRGDAVKSRGRSCDLLVC